MSSSYVDSRHLFDKQHPETQSQRAGAAASAARACLQGVGQAAGAAVRLDVLLLVWHALRQRARQADQGGDVLRAWNRSIATQQCGSRRGQAARMGRQAAYCARAQRGCSPAPGQRRHSPSRPLQGSPRAGGTACNCMPGQRGGPPGWKAPSPAPPARGRGRLSRTQGCPAWRKVAGREWKDRGEAEGMVSWEAMGREDGLGRGSGTLLEGQRCRELLGGDGQPARSLSSGLPLPTCSPRARCAPRPPRCRQRGCGPPATSAAAASQASTRPARAGAHRWPRRAVQQQ